MFEVGGHLFGAPVASVREVLEPVEATPIPGAVPAVLGLINLRGVLVVAAEMAAILGLPGAKTAEAALVVFERGGRRIALKVDRVAGMATPGDAEPDVDEDLLKVLGGGELATAVGRVEDRPYFQMDIDAVFERVLEHERSAQQRATGGGGGP